MILDVPVWLSWLPSAFKPLKLLGSYVSHFRAEITNLQIYLPYLLYFTYFQFADCYVEKGALHNKVYPELRGHCRSKGYELHIVDLHWKTLLEKQQDHEFPELCIGELTSNKIY